MGVIGKPSVNPDSANCSIERVVSPPGFFQTNKEGVKSIFIEASSLPQPFVKEKMPFNSRGGQTGPEQK